MSLSDLSVFVYGTLKPGGRYWPAFCAGKVDEPVPAKIRGELYDLHVGYPGLLLQGDSWVSGYILNFKTAEDLARLDGLEGYHSERSYAENEYIRLKLPAYSVSGEPLGKVWAYEITKPMLHRCQGTLIPDGNWPA
jgi:gamma-glutamylcyclotransferase (GGCT)/AIG2-like uncharacterized protein YtfP